MVTGICVLSPVHGCEIRGFLVDLLVVNYLFRILLKIKINHIRSDGLRVNLFGGGGGGGVGG